MKIGHPTVGELGLILFHMEKLGLLIPVNVKILETFAVYDEDNFAGAIQIYAGHAPSHVFGLSLCIVPEFRSKGFGQILIEHALDFCQAAGAKRVETCGDAENNPAAKLYEKMGFEREGVLKAWFPRGDEFVDAALYAKVI